MKILALSDEIVPFIYSPAVRERFGDVGLIVGCGDLPVAYLEYVVTQLNVPLVYVPGNHDPDEYTVHGGQSIDGRWTKIDGVAVGGLGGSQRYKPVGRHQYTDQEMLGSRIALVPLDDSVPHPPPRRPPDDRVGDTVDQRVGPAGRARFEHRPRDVPLEEVNAPATAAGEVRELMDEKALARAGKAGEEHHPLIDEAADLLCEPSVGLNHESGSSGVVPLHHRERGPATRRRHGRASAPPGVRARHCSLSSGPPPRRSHGPDSTTTARLDRAAQRIRRQWSPWPSASTASWRALARCYHSDDDR